MLHIDFETRGRVDLLSAGTYNYAQDLDTSVICMAYAQDFGEPQLWRPGDPVPAVFHMEQFATAWNADFERLIWDYIMVWEHGFPPIPLERWKCTAFAARCNNLPNKLENAARCLRTADQKDKRGRELIKLLCVPMADGGFCEDPQLLQEMGDYCLQDVRTEMALLGQLREPTEDEWADYWINCRINDRGVRVDVDLCRFAQDYAAEEEADLIARIEELTGGEVTKARGENLKAWVVARLEPHQEKLLVKYRDGERKLSLDRYNRERLLALEDIDPLVAEVVECSDFAQKSSVGKFKAMAALADPEDHRVRGAIWCNGASQSGRYSSKGMQLHNFPRDCMPDPQEVLADLADNILAEDITDYYQLPMMTVLARMLRPALVPTDGKVFLSADWAAVEGRVAPWLCGGNAYAREKLALYRDDAPVYEIAAGDIYHIPVEDVTKEQRQVGKVAELSLQFGGGAKAFLGMARNYGVVVPLAEAERIKTAWRGVNRWAEWIWNQLETAARTAVMQPGTRFTAGRLSYFSVENVLCGGRTLFCQLPDGRLLTYPDTRIEMQETPWGEVRPTLTALRAAFVPKVGEDEWPRTTLWGGLLFENAVQGTAASLLRWALRQAERQGLAVALHVHDQIVVESPRRLADVEAEMLADIMNSPPAWARSLPLKAEVETMERFGK